MSKWDFETELIKNGWTRERISELTYSLLVDGRVRPFDPANYIDEAEAKSILKSILRK